MVFRSGLSVANYAVVEVLRGVLEFRLADRAFHLWKEVGPVPAPEPATFVLIGSALLGLGLLSRRKQASLHS